MHHAALLVYDLEGRPDGKTYLQGFVHALTRLRNPKPTYVLSERNTMHFNVMSYSDCEFNY